jgi:hypothetical protein
MKCKYLILIFNLLLIRLDPKTGTEKFTKATIDLGYHKPSTPLE